MLFCSQFICVNDLEEVLPQWRSNPAIFIEINVDYLGNSLQFAVAHGHFFSSLPFCLEFALFFVDGFGEDYRRLWLTCELEMVIEYLYHLLLFIATARPAALLLLLCIGFRRIRRLLFSFERHLCGGDVDVEVGGCEALGRVRIDP